MMNVSFVNAYNYTEAVKVGGDAAAKLMIDNARTNAILNADPTDPTYVLKQQVEALKGERNAALAQLTALTIRSTLLAGYAKIGWPGHQQMIEGCTGTLDTLPDNNKKKNLSLITKTHQTQFLIITKLSMIIALTVKTPCRN